jgi:hypothetical protein
MGKILRRSLWEQPELFRSMPQRPTWRSLPDEVRQKTLQLLARLLRTAHAQIHNRSGAVAAAAKEVDNE